MAVKFSDAISDHVIQAAKALGPGQYAEYLDCKVDESWSKEALIAFAHVTMKELSELRELLRYP